MKLIFPIVLIICDLVAYLLGHCKRKRVLLLVALTAACGILNFTSYISDKTYCWEPEYREDNRHLAEQIIPYEEDGVIAFSTAVRGYLNMLLQCGIYEHKNMNFVKEKAIEKNKRYAIFLLREANPAAKGNMYDLYGALIYDRKNKNYLKIQSDKKISRLHKIGSLTLANLTDRNWTNGYKSKGKPLLFKYNEQLLFELLGKNYIVCDPLKHKISDIDFDNSWIRVCVEDEADDCMYPAVLNLE